MKIDAESARKQWGSSSTSTIPGQATLHAVSNLFQSASSISSTETRTIGIPKSLIFWQNNQSNDEKQQLNRDIESGTSSSSTGKFWSTTSQASNAISWSKRFKIFVLMILVSCIFFSMAMLFLPMVIIRPGKFALSFTFGSFSFMAAFAMLKGPRAYFKSLFDSKYIMFTAAYFSSLLFTLYSCLIMGNYLLVILSSVVQIIALAWYAFSALPGGTSSLKGMTAFRFL